MHWYFEPAESAASANTAGIAVGRKPDTNYPARSAAASLNTLAVDTCKADRSLAPAGHNFRRLPDKSEQHMSSRCLPRPCPDGRRMEPDRNPGPARRRLLPRLCSRASLYRSAADRMPGETVADCSATTTAVETAASARVPAETSRSSILERTDDPW